MTELKEPEKILCIGSVTVDIKAFSPEDDDGTEAYREGTIELVAGGVSRGMAINLKHLGLDSSICTYVGDDIFGDFVQRELKKEGVNTDLLRISSQNQTALFSVMASRNKSATCVYSTKILQEITLDKNVLDFIEREKIRNISMDSNLSPETFQEIYKYKEKHPEIFIFQNATAPDIANKTVKYARLINLFGCNEFEAAAILGEEVSPDIPTADHLQALGFENFIITFGGRGVLVRIGNETWIEPPYTPHHIVDTIGAGDAFASGFLMGFLNHEDTKRCIHYGLACAKETLLTRQTVSSLLTRDFLENYPEAEKK